METDTTAMVDTVVKRYRRELDRYRKFALHVGETLQVALRGQGILATVQWRAKHPESLRGKLYRSRSLRAFASADEALASVHDMAAVRICTYRHADRSRALAVVDELFAVVPGSVDDKDGERSQRTDYSQWYRATHLQLGIRPERVTPELENLVGDTCEIQVSSLLQHSWNEVEHDIGYKPTVKPPPNVTELLDKLGRWRETGDQIIDDLMRADAEFRQSLAQRSIVEYADFFTDASARLREPNGRLRLDSGDEAIVALHQALIRAGATQAGHLWDRAHPEWYVVPEPTIRAVNARLAQDNETQDLLSFGALLLVSEAPADRLLVALLPAVADRLATLQDGHYAAIAMAYLAIDRPDGG
jgi:ppGpp synthetase/RelA/SpoT-type nucleotidyltranferase